MLKKNNHMLNQKSLIFGLLSLALVIVHPAFAGEEKVVESHKQVSSETVAPFAKVYLALQGCTSCAACRSVIRQMTKGAAKDGKVSLPSDAVEISYDEPTIIPLKKVVGNLAKNRLHNLKLVDVLFDVSGRVLENSDGTMTFKIETTGQEYALSTPKGVEPPPADEIVRLSAVVQGWRGDEGLTLKLKSFKVNN